MHILFLKRKFSIYNTFRYPLKWIINLFTWSKCHHVASTFLKNGEVYVGEAKKPKYRHLTLEKWKDDIGSHNKIYAFKVRKYVNPITLLKVEKELKGLKYDVKGAINSATDTWPIFEDIFKAKEHNIDVFCSEACTIKSQKLGHLPSNIDPNDISPKEYMNLLKKHNIIYNTPEIWK